MVKIIQIGIHIEGEAVHGHPAAATHADGTDLSFKTRLTRIQPNAGLPNGSISHQSIIRHGLYDQLFQIAEVNANIGFEFLQVQDRITNNLLGAVESYVATPIGMEEPDAPLLPAGFVDQHMFHFSALADGINRRMLHQQEMVLSGFTHRLPAHILFEQGFLQVPGFLVTKLSQIGEQYFLHPAKLGIARPIFAKMGKKSTDLEREEPEELTEASDELYEQHVFRIDPGQELMRIDKFLVGRIEYATRNKVQKAIEAGRILVNGKTTQSNYKIRPADEVVVYSHYEKKGENIVPQDIPLNIQYEDDAVMIINKPAGLVVHPASGNPDGTLINGVAFYLQQQNKDISEENLPRFGMVHRIDKNTSGLMVLAKTDLAVTALAKQFFDHTVYRRYIALVWGDVAAEEGTVIAHIGRHKRFRKLFDAYPEGEYGKDAITHYKVLERLGYVTLVECRLETGRTHQIRVHMQHIGHPLFNDDFYGGDRIVKGTVYTKYKQFVENCFAICPRQALHARDIGFRHPSTGEQVLFSCEIPEDMSAVIEKWRRYTKAGATLND